MDEAAARAQAVAQFCQRHFIVIGDSILDQYVYGTALGKSAETPTIVAREIEVRESLGGACLLVRNLLALGARVDFVTLCGTDRESERLAAFKHPGLSVHLLRDHTRRTTTKKRYWVDGYKLLQFDQLDNRAIDKDRQEELVVTVARLISNSEPDAVLISDYRHGMLAQAVIGRLLRCAAAATVPVYVDSQVAQSTANHAWYGSADLIFLNLVEAQQNQPGFAAVPQAEDLAALCQQLGVAGLVVKLGAAGARAWIGGRYWAAAAWPVKPVDTIGAGDAFLAAYAACGAEAPARALAIANCWAGLSTEIHGPHPPELARLQAALVTTEAEGAGSV